MPRGWPGCSGRQIRSLTIRPLCYGILLAFMGCQNTPPPAPPSTPTPVATKVESSPQERALAAFSQFEITLKGKLSSAIEQVGPVGAIEVCNKEAPLIADKISREVGFPLGRASHKRRNPENSGPEWLTPYLEKNREKPVTEATVELFTLPDSEVGVARPIGIQPLCLTCHGESSSQSEELRNALSKFYPEDEAVGFKTGDFRGAFWAVVPETQSSSR